MLPSQRALLLLLAAGAWCCSGGCCARATRLLAGAEVETWAAASSAAGAGAGSSGARAAGAGGPEALVAAGAAATMPAAATGSSSSSASASASASAGASTETWAAAAAAANGSTRSAPDTLPPAAGAAAAPAPDGGGGALAPARPSGGGIRLRIDYSRLFEASSLLSRPQAQQLQDSLGPASIDRMASLLRVRSPVTGLLKAPLTGLPTPAECGFQLPSYMAAGVPDADFVWVAFANHFACARDGSGSVLLQSKYCDYDPATGRPTLGGLLICPSFFSIASQATRVESIVHEAFHVLGFTQSALERWRNPATAQPYVGQTLNKSADSSRPSWLTTPAATKFTRDFFACPELPGAPVDLSSGMHWWSSLRSDVMVGTSNDNSRVTPFILSAMEDTGWYAPNFGAAANPTDGKGSGCAAAGLTAA